MMKKVFITLTGTKYYFGDDFMEKRYEDPVGERAG